MLFQICALLLAAIPALAQDIASPDLLVGTWSSGAKNVMTGAGFAQPANTSFTYPATSGISYSFTADGHYEISRYRFTGNGSLPKCVTGDMNWSHGTYTTNASNAILMTTFGDGYQQIQNVCNDPNNFVQNYNYNETYILYQIFRDSNDGLKLHLFQWNGVPLPPMFLASSTPNMLPQQPLRNVTPAGPSINSDGVVTSPQKRSAADKAFVQNNVMILSATFVTALVGFVGPLLL